MTTIFTVPGTPPRSYDERDECIRAGMVPPGSVVSVSVQIGGEYRYIATWGTWHGGGSTEQEAFDSLMAGIRIVPC